MLNVIIKGTQSLGFIKHRTVVMRTGLGILYIDNRWKKMANFHFPPFFAPRKELLHEIYKLMQNKNVFPCVFVSLLHIF
jgi:hypothetical protein